MRNITASEVHLPGRASTKRRALFSLPLALGLCFTIAQQAKADFIGVYALNNFTLTNTNNGGFPTFTDGTATTPDGGQSVVLKGGDGGSGLAGTTDLFINAIAAGMIQFNWSYSSSDPSSAGLFPLGCGVGFAGSCDDAGYLLNGTFIQLADDIHQGAGLVQFSVTAGETFGFRVETLDNLGGAGFFTISNFTSVPEPSFPAVLFGLTAVLLGVQRWKASKLATRGENN